MVGAGEVETANIGIVKAVIVVTFWHEDYQNLKLSGKKIQLLIVNMLLCNNAVVNSKCVALWHRKKEEIDRQWQMRWGWEGKKKEGNTDIIFMFLLLLKSGYYHCNWLVQTQHVLLCPVQLWCGSQLLRTESVPSSECGQGTHPCPTHPMWLT